MAVANIAPALSGQKPIGNWHKKTPHTVSMRGVGQPDVRLSLCWGEPLKNHINDHDAEFTQPAEEKAK